jgi:uncharacterized membrane protein
MAERPEPKSLLRAILGVVSLVSSLVVIPIGFVLLVLDVHAASMVRPLAVLMAGGFLLAFGIALLIWEMSGRYGIRR